MRKSNRRFIAVLIALAVCTMAHAWSYDSEAATTTQAAQLRFGAGFTKKWNNGIRLGVSEDLRFDLYNSMVGPHFRKSYTTLDFGYRPIEYVNFDVGYTLRIIRVDSTWSVSKRANANK